MYCDENSLKLLVDSCNHFYKDSKILFIIDLQYRLLAISELGANIWNKENLQIDVESIIGKSLMDPFFHDFICPKEITSLFDQVIESEKEIDFIGVSFNRLPNYRLLHFYYEPIINPITNNIIAIKVEAKLIKYPLRWSSLSSFLKREFQHFFTTQLTGKDKLLSTREHEIIFLLFHMDTYEDIAEVINMNYNLQLTESAIGKYIRSNLYPKFKVNDKKSLKTRAQSLGYHKNIPISLLRPAVLPSEAF